MMHNSDAIFVKFCDICKQTPLTFSRIIVGFPVAGNQRGDVWHHQINIPVLCICKLLFFLYFCIH